MKSRSLVLLSLAGVLVAGVACSAGPFSLFSDTKSATAWRVGPQDVRIQVQTSASVAKPTLFVPRSLLVTTPRRTSALGGPTVVAGLALSGAFAAGGLWLTGRGRWRVAAVVIVALVGLGTGELLADIPGPFGTRNRREYVPQLPELRHPAVEDVAMPANVKLPSDVRLEIVDEGDTIRLVLPVPETTPGKAADLGAPAPIATSKDR